MELKYLALRIVSECPVCHNRNAPHYRLVEGGEYLCRCVILAEKKQDLLRQQQIHEVKEVAA
jgi:hypothetical protein